MKPSDTPSVSAASGDVPHNDIAANNVQRIAQLEHAARGHSTFGERLAESIAAFCGTMAFVWMHIAWFGAWVLFNTLPWFDRMRPDPYPFNFLTLVVSLEAIFLSAFILISQDRETKRADRRSHLDLQINMLAEQETTKTLHMLRRVCEKLGIDLENDPELDGLESATRPEAMLDLIENEMAKSLDTAAHEEAAK